MDFIPEQINSDLWTLQSEKGLLYFGSGPCLLWNSNDKISHWWNCGAQRLLEQLGVLVVDWQVKRRAFLALGFYALPAESVWKELWSQALCSAPGCTWILMCRHKSQYSQHPRRLTQLLPLHVLFNYLCFYLKWAALAPALWATCLPEPFSCPRFLLLSCESCIPWIDAALPCPGRVQGQTAAGGGRNEAPLIPTVNLCSLPATTRELWKSGQEFCTD